MTSPSLQQIKNQQAAWAASDPTRQVVRGYTPAVTDNLFPGALSALTRSDFEAGDGGELGTKGQRPTKMCALRSSSALAVNFFSPWRTTDLAPLMQALGMDGRGLSMAFEYRPTGYPVPPRRPNLDLRIWGPDGTDIGIESKFCEPYDAHTAKRISPRYFPKGKCLWGDRGLEKAEELARRCEPRWTYLDVPQLLKHMLGLAYASEGAPTLLYLWFDTGLEDARGHREEVDRFARSVEGDRVRFASLSYQELFGRISPAAEPAAGWHAYMAARYFG